MCWVITVYCQKWIRAIDFCFCCFFELLALVTSALVCFSCVRLLLVPHNSKNRRECAQQNGLHVVGSGFGISLNQKTPTNGMTLRWLRKSRWKIHANAAANLNLQQKQQELVAPTLWHVAQLVDRIKSRQLSLARGINPISWPVVSNTVQGRPPRDSTDIGGVGVRRGHR